MLLPSQRRVTPSSPAVSRATLAAFGSCSTIIAIPLRRAGDDHLGCGLDRLDDLLVAGAAAEDAADRLADLVAGAAARMRADELDRRHQHRGRAEAALQGVVLGERLLERAERAVALGETLDGLDRVPVGLHGEHEARADALPVEQHVAVAAEAVLAGEVRAREVEILAQEVGQRAPRLDVALAPGAVDLHPHVVGRVVPRRSRCLLVGGARRGVAQRAARQRRRRRAAGRRRRPRCRPAG